MSGNCLEMGTFVLVDEMIRVPSPQTLKKYGLSSKQWIDILRSQGDVCAVCKKVPKSGRLVTDHVHVQNYRYMSPEKKRLWVRGILCVHCNRFYVAKGITAAKARNVVTYLERFEERKPK